MEDKKALEEMNITHCVMHSKMWGTYGIFLLSIMELHKVDRSRS